jgi:hypothetical protein
MGGLDAAFGQLVTQLEQRLVARFVHQAQDQLGVRLDPMGLPVAALRSGRGVACVSQSRAPAHCAGRAHPEPGRGLSARRALVNGLNDPASKVHRQ